MPMAHSDCISGSEVLAGAHGYSRPLRCGVIKVQGGAGATGGLLATFPIDFQLDEEGHRQGV